MIGLILVGYSIFTKPAREAQMAERRRMDSLARVEQVRALEEAQRQRDLTVANPQETQAEQDSASMERLSEELGDFVAGALGEEEK